MATLQRRNRELLELEEDTREALRRSYELIRQSEKLVAQSKALIRFSISRDPNHTQETRKPQGLITD